MFFCNPDFPIPVQVLRFSKDGKNEIFAQGAEPGPGGGEESSEESSEDEPGAVEMRPRAPAQGQQVLIHHICHFI